MTIQDLSPKALWENFYLLTRCPRPSKHEGPVRDFLVKWAQERNIECIVDAIGNVILRKGATCGLENRVPVVLQAHMDMVPQARAGKVHDFEKDPIETKIVGEWVYACDTTLGADDGLGVAAIMAVFEDDSIAHGPIEALITTDEETGMTGAFGIEPGVLHGRYLLNLDSETEGELYVGCAGGIDATVSVPVAFEAMPADYVSYKVAIKGLKGGHSGMEINQGRGNANKLLFRHVRWVAECGIRIAELEGGTLRNAIPRDAHVVLAFPKAHKDCILAEFDKVAAAVKKELSATEPDFAMCYEPVDNAAQVLNNESTQKIINLMMVAPNGVIRMSQDMAGLVETSLNLARVEISDGNFVLKSLLRSSVDSAKEALAERLVCLAEMVGGSCELTGAYPGWKPNMQSGLLKMMKQTYNKLYNVEPAVVAIHAGLECGLLGAKYPEMEMISFGPTLNSPHSPDERANIPSAQKYYDYLLAALANMPEVEKA